MLRRVRSWFGAVVRRSRMEREMDAELRFHIEVFAEDLVGSGVSREEALRRARIEFGGVARAKEECRDALALRLVDRELGQHGAQPGMGRFVPGLSRFSSAGEVTCRVGCLSVH